MKSMITAASTASLANELRETQDIDHYLIKNKDNMLTYTLSDYLTMLLAQKNISIANVVRDSLLDRSYVYDIFAGRKKPSRNKLVALAFGLKLTDDETQKMLKVSGNRELYARDVRDSIILFALRQHMDIDKTNELLFNHELPALGISEE